MASISEEALLFRSAVVPAFRYAHFADRCGFPDL